MTASGQVAEAFPLLRLCIEYALYALYINSNPNMGEIWMCRHDDDAARARCRKSFKHESVIASLEKRDPGLFKNIKKLYELTIDFGAHPNEQAITSNVMIEEESDKKTYQSLYLHGDGIFLDHAIKTAAQIGLGSLLIFEHIFRDCFRLLGINFELQELRKIL